MNKTMELWLQIAKMDLDTCNYLMQMTKPPYPIICYHAQQAVEKCLKAFIIQLFPNEAVRQTHDIGLLLGKIKQRITVSHDLEQNAVSLTAYAVDARYPGGESLGSVEAKLAIDSAEIVRAWVLEQLT